MFSFRFPLKLVACLAIFAAVATWSYAQVDYAAASRGPCRPMTSSVPNVPSCESSCTLYCTDFCVNIAYSDGTCRNADNTHCQEYSVTLAAKKCRDCNCEGFSWCLDEGLYNSGLVTRRNCTGAVVIEPGTVGN